MSSNEPGRPIIKMIPLVEAAARLGIPYSNAYDYMMRQRLKGRKMKPKGKRRGWYVTESSVIRLQYELHRNKGVL